MENKSHALAAGSFVLILLGLVIGLSFWLTRDTTPQRFYELSSKDAVTGLQLQAAVRYKGVKIGKVIDIGFDPQASGNVLIRIAIDDRAPLTQSTYAQLGYQGVTGLAFVQLDDDGSSKVELPAGDGTPIRLPLRPSQLSSLTDQGTALVQELQETSRRVNLLLEPGNRKLLMSSIDDMGRAAKGIEQLTTRASRVLDTQFNPQLVNFPKIAEEANITLKALQATSERVSVSADEARASALAFKKVTERMNEKGGTLDQLTRGMDTLVSTGQTLNAATLPRLNRAIDDTAQAARQISRVVNTINDNPQSLILGTGPTPVGPGEPGFVATPATK